MGIGRFLKKAGKFVAQAAYQPAAGLYNMGVGAAQGDWKQAKMGAGQWGKGALKLAAIGGAVLAAPAVGGAVASGAGAVGGAASGAASGISGFLGGTGTAAAGSAAVPVAKKGIGAFLKNNALDIAKVGLGAYGAHAAGSAVDAELAASREQWEQQFGLDKQLADERIAQAAWERQRQEKLDEEKRARSASMDPIRGQLLQAIIGNQAPTRR